MKKVKNICPECGGCLLIEAIGNYGDVYCMKANGEMSKKHIKRYSKNMYSTQTASAVGWK